MSGEGPAFEGGPAFEPAFYKDSAFFKENPTDKVWWVDTFEYDGILEFSFDKKKVYNLFADYPHGLTKEERETFDRENPFWADFFADRG